MFWNEVVHVDEVKEKRYFLRSLSWCICNTSIYFVSADFGHEKYSRLYSWYCTILRLASVPNLKKLCRSILRKQLDFWILTWKRLTIIRRTIIFVDYFHTLIGSRDLPRCCAVFVPDMIEYWMNKRFSLYFSWLL